VEIQVLQHLGRQAEGISKTSAMQSMYTWYHHLKQGQNSKKCLESCNTYDITKEYKKKAHLNNSLPMMHVVVDINGQMMPLPNAQKALNCCF